MSDDLLSVQRKRLIFRSGHRGTKEMDLILGAFAIQFVPDFNLEELADYEALLTHNDPDLYNWITGKEAPPDDVAGMMVFHQLRNHRAG